jgi:hypothetical protein
VTWHPSEDDLVLHFYGESRPSEKQRFAEHLETCAPCRASWLDLGDTLKLVDAAPVPEPGPDFERVMWARVQQALPTPAAPWWSMARLLPFAAAAAVVVVAAVAGTRIWLARQAPVATSGPAVAKASSPRERVMLAALDEHFETTQALLVDLMNAPEAGGSDNAGADLSFERITAGELVSSGRLYRVTARQNGDMQFARMLDDLEPVLVDVAHAPDRITRNDLQSLRARIDDASLLFKVRALSNEIRDREKKSAIGVE